MAGLFSKKDVISEQKEISQQTPPSSSNNSSQSEQPTSTQSMQESEEGKSNKVGIIMGILLVAIIIGFGIYFIFFR